LNKTAYRLIYSAFLFTKLSDSIDLYTNMQTNAIDKSTIIIYNNL